MNNTNGLARTNDNAAMAPAFNPTPEQRQMIRDAYANGASDSEFAVLMEIARARQLNPLLRQVHFVKRWNNELRRDTWSAQVSIDGLRAIAQRTGLYAGQDEPEFVEGDKPDGYPVLCKVRVYRTDWQRPAVGVAYWREYVQTTKDGHVTKMWRQFPHVMLSKVAESIALRKAFPEDIGGLYSDAEMSQAEHPIDDETPKRRAPIDAAPQPLALPRDNGPSPSGAPLPDAAPAVDHCEIAERLIDGASTLDGLKAAWAVVYREHLPHLGPHETLVITEAKGARKEALAAKPPAPKPDGDEPPPNGPTGGKRARKAPAPADATGDAPAGAEGATAGPQAVATWLRSRAETERHVATKTAETALRNSARLHGRHIAATPWGVGLYALRLQSLSGMDYERCEAIVRVWCGGDARREEVAA